MVIVVTPVVRDHDGLAFSSRNAYLSDDERKRAVAIPAGLSAAATAFAGGETRSSVLRDLVRASMETAGFDIDYVAAVDAESLAGVEDVRLGCQILVAGRMGSTRLIDAIRLGIDEAPLDGAGRQGSEIPGVIGIQGRE